MPNDKLGRRIAALEQNLSAHETHESQPAGMGTRDLEEMTPEEQRDLARRIAFYLSKCALEGAGDDPLG